MTTFLISYELSQPAANKHAIASAIMSSGSAWARPLDNTWLVRSDESAAELEARISGPLGEHDGLLVQAIADEAAMTNAATRWFKRRVAPIVPAPAEILAFPARRAADSGQPQHRPACDFEYAEAV